MNIGDFLRFYRPSPVAYSVEKLRFPKALKKSQAARAFVSFRTWGDTRFRAARHQDRSHRLSGDSYGELAMRPRLARNCVGCIFEFFQQNRPRAAIAHGSRKLPLALPGTWRGRRLTRGRERTLSA